MTLTLVRIKYAVTACLLILSIPLSAFGQSARLDELFTELSDPDLENWQLVEREIWTEWSKSGSPSADLLLERGREAMVRGDLDAAVDHLTALIDHAPDFAEGYNARATAFHQLGLYGPSLRDIEATLALNPRHFGALSGLGMIMEELGFDAEALEAYRAVIAIHPHRADVEESIDRLELETGGTAL